MNLFGRPIVINDEIPNVDIVFGKVNLVTSERTFDLESIEKRYLAGSPAKEDLGDLIAEVKRLSVPKTSEVSGNTTSKNVVKAQEIAKKTEE